MASKKELEFLVLEPREDLAIEYKGWLKIDDLEDKARIAKAAIALANHGGGYVVIGFDESGDSLLSTLRPPEHPDFTQDGVNSCIRRFASPEFHCELYFVDHPTTGACHPVVRVPASLTTPVMSTRDCGEVLKKNRCYIRKPGPRSEEPQNGEEWRALLDRCVRAGRESLLDAIRGIVTGRLDITAPVASVTDKLKHFAEASHERWKKLVASLPAEASGRFPNGFYEMAFCLPGAKPTSALKEINDRLALARSVKLTGWSPFLDASWPEWRPYIQDAEIEAWLGAPRDGAAHDAAHSDFWRASLDGSLYLIRGYQEDSLSDVPIGQLIDVTLPVWRVGEALLFVDRFAQHFEDASEIAIRCRFTGLSGRELTSLSGMRSVFTRECRTDEVLLEKRFLRQHFRDNLVELLHDLLKPLYERFDFMELPVVLVREELKRMAG